jgi:hypothetical protein
MKFRKLPVVIEAIQYNPSSTQLTGDFLKSCNCWLDTEGHLIINTLEGEMRVSLNDWIIKGIEGEFYPCKPDIFDKTYTQVFDEEETDTSPIVEKDYQEFWRNIISKQDGSLDIEQVKKELYDYHQYMQETAKVYDYITGGLISKVNTKADVVKQYVDEHYDKIYKEYHEDECDECKFSKEKVKLWG